MTMHCKFNPFIHMTSLNNYMSLDYCQHSCTSGLTDFEYYNVIY